MWTYQLFEWWKIYHGQVILTHDMVMSSKLTIMAYNGMRMYKVVQFDTNKMAYKSMMISELMIILQFLVSYVSNQCQQFNTIYNSTIQHNIIVSDIFNKITPNCAKVNTNHIL